MYSCLPPNAMIFGTGNAADFNFEATGWSEGHAYTLGDA